MGMGMGMVVAVTVTVSAMVMEMVGGGSWCVAKIGVSEEALQRALDSACGGEGGADCGPIQPHGLCFTPNTVQAHASYAFNSFYQRNDRASHACLFDGASTIAQTDPSYGSCVYPSSSGTAIGTPTARNLGIRSLARTLTCSLTPLPHPPYCTAGVTNTNKTVITTPGMDNPSVPTPTSTTTTPIHGGDTAGMNPLIPQNSTPTPNTMTTSFLLYLLILFLRETYFVV